MFGVELLRYSMTYEAGVSISELITPGEIGSV
jgi:hypothetical protein